MNNSVIGAAASLGALQQKLDILAGNIANVNTTGYKRKSAVFEDILTNIQPHEQSFLQPGRRSPLGYTQGWGARVVAQQLDMAQGAMQQTDIPTDVAIAGNALFEVRSGGSIDSARAFTRQGAFQLKPTDQGDRLLTTNSGYPVVANVDGQEDFIRVPNGYEMIIAADGTITARLPNGTEQVELGKLKLVQVTKPELLQAVADNLYGVPSNVNVQDVVADIQASPETTGGVSVRQGFTEQSNVNLTDEIADLVNVQRAYQLSARALSSGDQMMQMATNLRG
ncbi:flagellar hook-basal body protein [Cohnella nanjingensis]|uniref:Flagellar hook-basal body protein n=1 Tax=Cohnella nanjingensis TaxID=1387779 RepID=A0A7X0RNM5_9BACL|nr:flagellar hook-basal body protein [Cohnella nanjingensis]MBB6670603.1 flagellar hook-basal body protein [Cohnella nanjingensis]